jgi:hypothetical protein
MAKKGKSFADKVAKSLEQHGEICPTCGETIKPVMVVSPIVSERSGAFRFRRKLVGVCSCNSKEVLG